MANCKWCNQDPFDPAVTTCTGNTEVEFPDGRTHPAVPYSGHFDLYEVPEEDAVEPLRRCGCCKVAAFGFHHPMCSAEQCPVCAGQLIGCGCLDDDEDDGYGEKREPVDTESLLAESIAATGLPIMMGLPRVVRMSDEETFGRFPIRRDLTVLPPEDPTRPKRTFDIRQGEEIGRLVNGVVDETPLCRREDLEEGMSIVVTTLVGRYNAVVEKDEDGEFYWRVSEHFTGNLEFDIDDRHCWTTSAAYNTKGMIKFDD